MYYELNQLSKSELCKCHVIELEAPIRVAHAFRELNIQYIGELIRYTEAEVRQFPLMTESNYHYLCRSLKELGLELGTFTVFE